MPAGDSNFFESYRIPEHWRDIIDAENKKCIKKSDFVYALYFFTALHLAQTCFHRNSCIKQFADGTVLFSF